MTNLMSEVARFREWADAIDPDRRSGEWECDYPGWGPLYEAVVGLVSARPFSSWTAEEVDAVLYAVARDNEMQHLAGEIGRHPETLLDLARAAADRGEPESKWQLAEELGRLGQGGEDTESLLFALANDPAEYVRRRSLQALARLQSPTVEALAMKEWHRPDDNQQWVRMNVLWCLHRVGSSLLGPLLENAGRDERPYLSDFAEAIRQGRVSD